MGLLDKLLGKPAQKAETPRETPQPAEPEETDNRPYVPNEVLVHRGKCIHVGGPTYYQDVLGRLEGDVVKVKLRKAGKEAYWDYNVILEDGTVVGTLSEAAAERGGFTSRGTYEAEVSRPIYYGTSCVELYIRWTAKALERAAERESLKLWINLDATKWEGPTDKERLDYYDCEFVVSEPEGKKPLISVLADGKRLLQVNSRMKCYGDLMERKGHRIRRLIVERKDGANSPFYRLGFYF